MKLPGTPSRSGPDLEDPKSQDPYATDAWTQTTESGVVIPTVWGTAKLAGNVIEKNPPLKIAAAGAPLWQASHAYAVGDVVVALVSTNGAYVRGYVCTTAGTSASSGLGPNGDPGVDIIDGTVHWNRIADGYRQCIAIGLCEGPIAGIGAAWRDKYLLRNFLHLAAGNVPAWAANTAYVPGDVRQVGGSFYACTVGGTSVFAVPPGATPSGTGTDIVDGTVHWSYIPSPAVNIILLTGTQPQTRPLWAQRAIQGYADTYSNTALIFFDTSSGSSNDAPNLAWEIQGIAIQAVDANPADIIIDLLTHSRRGAGWSTSRVDTAGSLGAGAASIRTYCTQAGLLLSRVLDSQQSALDLLADVLAAINTDAVWSGGVLKFVPRCDQVVGTFTPNVTPIYDLDRDDWLSEPQIQRKRPADCFNSTPVQFIRRTDATGALVYQTDVVDNPDMADIDLRGRVVKAPTQNLPWVMDPGAAVMMSRILTQRSLYLRNTWTLRVPGWRYCLLEPTDIVTASDPVLDGALYPRKMPVKITAFEETLEASGASTITLTCEDYPAAAHHAAQYQPQAGDGYKPQAGDAVSSILIGAGQVGQGVLWDGGLTRSNFDNLWPNPNSEMNPPAGADLTSPEWSWRAQALTSPYAVNGDYVRYFDNRSGGSQATLPCDVACAPGDAFYFEAQALQAAGSGGVGVFMAFLDKVGAVTAYGSSTTYQTTSAAWSKVSISGAAPAASVVCRLYLFAQVGAAGWWDSIYARRMIGQAIVAPLGWTALTAYTDWTMSADCAYAVDVNGVVRLRGWARSTSAANSNPVLAPSIPTGCRPLVNRLLSIVTSTGASEGMWVTSAGGLITALTPVAGRTYYLDGLTYQAEQ